MKGSYWRCYVSPYTPSTHFKTILRVCKIWRDTLIPLREASQWMMIYHSDRPLVMNSSSQNRESSYFVWKLTHFWRETWSSLRSKDISHWVAWICFFVFSCRVCFLWYLVVFTASLIKIQQVSILPKPGHDCNSV